MDFDIGNILYVVITLVAIAVSLLGKKKKPGGTGDKPGFFENLDQVLKMGQENPVFVDLRDDEPDLNVEAEEPVYEDIKMDQGITSEAPSLMEEYERLLIGRGGSLLEAIQMEGERSTEPLELVELDEMEGPDYFRMVSEFDAGTAILYSAIINRPDY
jgi:hypothetical protein